MRALIEKAAQSLDDADALEGKLLYPLWSGDGIQYTVGEKVRYDDVLYKVLQSHKSQPVWTPVSATGLFAKVLIPDPEVIPDWEQPDSTNPYMKGDKVRYNGQVYESVIDNNIWSPADYPAGWTLISENT